MSDRPASTGQAPVGMPSLGPARGGPMGGARKIEKARDPRGALRRLAATMRPFLPSIVVVLVMATANAVLGLLGPLLLGRAIDTFIVHQGVAGILVPLIELAAVYAAGWAAGLGESLLMQVISQKALRGLRQDLFEHMQTLSLSFFDRRPHGELMSRLTNDIDAINRALMQSVTGMFSGIMTLVGVIVMMFVLNPLLAVGAITVLPFMVLMTTAVARRTRRGFRDLQARLSTLNGVMEETITGENVVQAYGQEKAAIARFETANDEVLRTGTRAQVVSMLVPPLMGVLSNMDIAVVAGFGGWLALRGLVSVGSIAAFAVYARRFAEPLRTLADLYNTIQSALAGAERVFEVLDERPEVQDAPGATDPGRIEGDVEFLHVDFGYIPGVPVLKDVTLRALPGQTVALVGPTGAGKTTIVNVLSRFYDTEAGTIRIDGRDIRTLRIDGVRRQLGIVLQDTFLFSDTVMENIRYGRLDATDEECIAAATLANADQFIRRLPEGYATELSERAGNISQGQRQLLAIARAVLADPRILILDEATSSVDTRTEVRIQEALLRLMRGRTSFVIAHRLSTIRKADEVLVIDGGRIIERGTHDALIAADGFYRRMYMSQFRSTGAAETHANESPE
ncbi:MAG TPA: ABC transporter ATP-binding protein [Spirochaetia bacterium]